LKLAKHREEEDSMLIIDGFIIFCYGLLVGINIGISLSKS
jgi:hypothetical protein